MQTLTLPRLTGAQGEVALPGSKSLSNRLLLLAALAEGETELLNLLDSDDVRHMLTALAALGVRVINEPGSCRVVGIGGPFVSSGEVHLFLGNAGTAVRPLTAALAFSSVTAELTGEPRMYERPIGDLLAALRELGADALCRDREGFLPLNIRGRSLAGGRVAVRGDVSSQFLTALLMAAPLLDGDLTIEVTGELVSKPYIDITLHTMANFGVKVENHQYQTLVVPGGVSYVSPGSITVEGDASSASYFLAAGALGGGPVRVTGAGRKSVQGDVRFAEVLQQMGAKVTWGDYWIEVAGGKLRGVDVDLNHIPDAAMTLATVALFADGPTRIRNVYNWRVKETDRLAAMATELRKLGATVEEGRDYLHITPPAVTRGAAIDTYNDHRMAMCFALAAFGEGEITINDPGCVSKTFPTFFEELDRVTGKPLRRS